MADEISQRPLPLRVVRLISSHAAGIVPGSPYLPIARPAYFLQAAYLAAIVLCIAFSDFTLGTGPFSALLYLLLWVSFAALAARRYGMPRIAGFLESISFASVSSLLTVCGTLIAASISGRFQDDWLIASDRMMGFDWVALYRFSRLHPFAVHLLDTAYSTLAVQSVVVPLALLAMGQERVMWSFFTAWLVALILTTLERFPFILVHSRMI